jgi:prepilin-type N-terminal cleavage/methylation domain-containing protein
MMLKSEKNSRETPRPSGRGYYGPRALIAAGGSQRSARKSPNSRGFTLIEVLATILLISIVLPVVMRGINVALSAADTARHTSEASSLGEEKLNEMLTDGSITTTTSGDFGTDYPAYTWTIQTNQRDYGMEEVVMTIVWTASGGQRTLKLSTMISTETASNAATASAATGGITP